MPLKILFAGSPDFVVPVLDILRQSHHSIIGVLTKPDRPTGRGRRVQANPVKVASQSYGIPVLQPETLRDQVIQRELKNLNADVMVVAGYGILLPKTVIDIPTHGSINIHPSLLPKWRGATPVQSSLLHGEEITGVTVFQITEGMDAGDILAQETYHVKDHQTTHELYKILFEIGGKLSIKVLDEIEAGTIKPQPQNEKEATYCKMIKKIDAEINWELSAKELANRVRAYNDWPVAYTHFKGSLLRIWEAQAMSEQTTLEPGTVVNVNKSGLDIACGNNCLRLLRVQMPGGKPVSIIDFINAHKNDLVSGVSKFG